MVTIITRRWRSTELPRALQNITHFPRGIGRIDKTQAGTSDARPGLGILKSLVGPNKSQRLKRRLPPAPRAAQAAFGQLPHIAE